MKKSVNFKRKLSLILIAMSLFFSISSNTVKGITALEEAREIIKSNYVTEVSEDILNKSNIEDIIKGLNDPYSQYFTKEEYNAFVNIVNNKFTGIGVVIEEVKEGIKIQSVFEGSPAKEVGVNAGDIIIKADGHDLVGLAKEVAVSYIKGAADTYVTLEIKRGEEVLQFKVQRRELNLPTVEGKMLDNNVAYMKIISFGADTEVLFREKLGQLNLKNPNSYIIDLRDNGGGYLKTALEIAGHFIGESTAVTMENNSGYVYEEHAVKQELVIDKPIIFLINENSASASEILSAAVKDYKKALFVGTTTFGKGVAQNLYNLSDGSYLKLTTFKFLSPLGNVINKVGVSPNLNISGDVDSLKLSEILLNKDSEGVDKTGLLRAKIGDFVYYLKLSQAVKAEYWKESSFLLNNFSSENINLGAKDGWKTLSQGEVLEKYKLLYPEEKKLASIGSIDNNKTFTVKVDKSITLETFKSKSNIELIDSSTGERVGYEVTALSDKEYKIKPQKTLKPATEYYIKVKNSITTANTK